MKIETKYSIGDEVFFLNSNKVWQGKIIGILYTVGDNRPNDKYSYQEPRYNVSYNGSYIEGMYDQILFKTKQELLNSL